jgi:hypothetical protein
MNHLTSIAHKVIQPTQTVFYRVGISWKVLLCSMKPFTSCIGKNKMELSSRLILTKRMIRPNGRLCEKYLK